MDSHTMLCSLKPGNILLGDCQALKDPLAPVPNVQLGDFGLSVVLEKEPESYYVIAKYVAVSH